MKLAPLLSVLLLVGCSARKPRFSTSLANLETYQKRLARKIEDLKAYAADMQASSKRVESTLPKYMSGFHPEVDLLRDSAKVQSAITALDKDAEELDFLITQVSAESGLKHSRDRQ